MTENEYKIILVNQLEDTNKYYGIDMTKWVLEAIEYDEDSGSCTWLHVDNDKSLPYAERRLQCTGFIYDENLDIINTNIPFFT